MEGVWVYRIMFMAVLHVVCTLHYVVDIINVLLCLVDPLSSRVQRRGNPLTPINISQLQAETRPSYTESIQTWLSMTQINDILSKTQAVIQLQTKGSTYLEYH